MERETIWNFSPLISGVESQRQLIVLVIGAKRVDESGEALELTESQKEAAMYAAKSALEITPGTDVTAQSTAFIVPTPELDEGESLTMTIDAKLTRTTSSSAVR